MQYSLRVKELFLKRIEKTRKTAQLKKNDAAGVSAAIVRKDFSQLNIYGQKRGGYDIVELSDVIGKILGKGEAENVIVVGCGRIGMALMHYSGFVESTVISCNPD